MAATSKAKYRTTPETLEAAISAYLSTPEGIRSIERRLKIPNMAVYRELDKRGIDVRRRPYQRPREIRICALDGCDAVLSTNQQKYCCRDHVHEAFRRFCEETREERMRRRIVARRPRKPFGYRIEKSEEGQLLPDEREQAAIAEMRKLRADGQSLRGITVVMRRQGFDISRHIVAAICGQALAA